MTPQEQKNQQAACGCLGCFGLIIIFIAYILAATPRADNKPLAKAHSSIRQTTTPRNDIPIEQHIRIPGRKIAADLEKLRAVLIAPTDLSQLQGGPLLQGTAIRLARGRELVYWVKNDLIYPLTPEATAKCNPKTYPIPPQGITVETVNACVAEYYVTGYWRTQEVRPNITPEEKAAIALLQDHIQPNTEGIEFGPFDTGPHKTGVAIASRLAFYWVKGENIYTVNYHAENASPHLPPVPANLQIYPTQYAEVLHLYGK